MYDAHAQLMAADETITTESLSNSRFQGKIEKPITLIEAFKDHNEKMESLVGRECIENAWSYQYPDYATLR